MRMGELATTCMRQLVSSVIAVGSCAFLAGFGKLGASFR